MATTTCTCTHGDECYSPKAPAVVPWKGVPDALWPAEQFTLIREPSSVMSRSYSAATDVLPTIVEPFSSNRLPAERSSPKPNRNNSDRVRHLRSHSRPEQSRWPASRSVDEQRGGPVRERRPHGTSSPSPDGLLQPVASFRPFSSAPSSPSFRHREPRPAESLRPSSLPPLSRSGGQRQAEAQARHSLPMSPLKRNDPDISWIVPMKNMHQPAFFHGYPIGNRDSRGIIPDQLVDRAAYVRMLRKLAVS